MAAPAPALPPGRAVLPARPPPSSCSAAMRSAALSAIAVTTALIWPHTSDGIADASKTCALLCGVKGMTEGVKDVLKEAGVPDANVLFNF